MFDATITLGNVLTIIALAVAGLAAFFFQRSRIDVLQQRLNSMELAHAETFGIARKTRDELVAFRLHVTEAYVQHPSMEKVEARLLAGMERLTSEISGLRVEIREITRAARGKEP